MCLMARPDLCRPYPLRSFRSSAFLTLLDLVLRRSGSAKALDCLSLEAEATAGQAASSTCFGCGRQIHEMIMGLHHGTAAELNQASLWCFGLIPTHCNSGSPRSKFWEQRLPTQASKQGSLSISDGSGCRPCDVKPLEVCDWRFLEQAISNWSAQMVQTKDRYRLPKTDMEAADKCMNGQFTYEVALITFMAHLAVERLRPRSPLVIWRESAEEAMKNSPALSGQ